MTYNAPAESYTCPFCNSNEIKRYQQRTDGNWILTCTKCGLGFIDTYPDNTLDWYDQRYYCKTAADDDRWGYLNYPAFKADHLLWAVALVKLTKVRGSLLDIGCANGLFLDLAKSAGFENLQGVEASEEYAQLARAKHSIIYNGDFREGFFDQTTKFDIVTAWSTLETIPSLRNTFLKIKNLLKPEGLLFFELPCLSFNAADNYWCSNRFENIYYFSEKFLRNLCQQFFDSNYIGRVVSLPGAGMRLVGFVSQSQSRLQDLQEVGNYLNWISQAELSLIDIESQFDYLIFYLFYLEDFDTANSIAEDLHNNLHLTKPQSIYFYYILTLAKHYIQTYQKVQDYKGSEEYFLAELANRYFKEWSDNNEYSKAKEYFISQIDYRDKDIENLNKIIKHEQVQLNSHQELIARQEKQLSELPRLGKIEKEYHHLKQYNTELLSTLEEKNYNSSVKDQALASQAYQIWIRDVHIQNLTNSKLYRLKEALATDPISLRKFVRIAYIMAALLTPGPIKKPLRPLVSLLKQTANRPIAPHFTPAEPVAETVEQQPWPAPNPLVSVVIPCYNYGEYLTEAIDSVLKQTFKNIEIIVVDDGSTEPHTLKILEQLNTPKTRLLRQKNQGVVRTRNNGIRQAQGKYICCLDADDLLHPTYLEKCVIKMESENLDVCYPWLQEFGDGDMLYRTGAFEIEKLMQENVVVIAAVFKKSIWQQVGGFKVNGYEDWEFWLSIAEAGGIGARINEPLFLYRKHGYSRVDYLLERHQRNFVEIQRQHRRLYKYPQEVEKAKQRQHRHFRVKKPYVNLTQSQSLNLAHNNPHVLLALPFTIVGGGDRVLLHVMKALTQFRNFNFSVVTTVPLLEEEEQRLGTTTPEYEKFTDEIYHLPKFLNQEQWRDFIFYIIESRNIQVIYQAGSIFMYKLLPDIKRRYPHIKVIDQMFNAYGHIENNRKYARYIDHIVSDNDAVKKALVERYNEAPQKVSVVHTGVDTFFYQREEAESYQVFDKHSQLPPGKFIISYLGRLSEEKWPELFVEIARNFQQDERVHFVIGGNGPLYNKIRDLIDKYNLEDKVYLPGFVDSKQFLNVSNLLILPSKIDGWPNIILESLAMNVPAIVSNVGGLRWMIEDGFNGYVCEVGEQTQFIEAIKKLLNNPALYLEMRRHAREYAVANLNITKMYEAYIQVFDDLLSGPQTQL